MEEAHPSLLPLLARLAQQYFDAHELQGLPRYR